MSKIIVKVTSHYLNCEKVEGGETEFLGFQIDSFEKLKEIPDNFKYFSPEDLKDSFSNDMNSEAQALINVKIDYDERLCSFFDIRAMNELYNEMPDNNIINKYKVNADCIYKNEDNEFLYVFNNDSYSKFVYLFNLEKRLFQWTF